MNKFLIIAIFFICLSCSSSQNQSVDKTNVKVEVSEVSFCKTIKLDNSCVFIKKVNDDGVEYFQHLKLVFESYMSEKKDLKSLLVLQKKLAENMIENLNKFACSFAVKKNRVEDILEEKVSFEEFLKKINEKKAVKEQIMTLVDTTEMTSYLVNELQRYGSHCNIKEISNYFMNRILDNKTLIKVQQKAQ